DSESQGNEADVEQPSIFHGGRRVWVLKRSTIAMSTHCVSMQEAVVPKVEDGRIHRQDSKRNRRGVEQKLVEREVDQWRRADDNIRRITHHRRNPAHVRRQTSAITNGI